MYHEVVPGGIDIGAETVVVATGEGTRGYRNAVRAVDDGDETGESVPTAQVEGTVYAIGSQTGVSADEDADVTRLFDGVRGRYGANVAGSALEALFDAVGGSQPDERLLGDELYGYVNRDPETLNLLSRLASDRGFDVVPVDPGMAVCYDAFDAPPDGVGIALGNGRASATLAVGGVPVATATVTYRERWYDVSEAVADVSTSGVRAAWNREQYRALFAALAAELAERAPALSGPVAVAVGGETTPAGLVRDDLLGVGDALGVPVESVTVAEAAGETPARGAMVATQPDARSGAIPAFAATDAFAPGFADVGAATAAFADTLTDDDPAGGRENGSTAPDQGQRLGLALGAVVDGLDSEAGRLRRQVGDVETAVTDVETELSELEGRTAGREAVATLKAAVDQTDSRVDALADDIAEIQAVLAGLEGESADGSDVAGAFESVAVDAIQEDIDAVETALTERIEALWEEIDETSGRLVDLSARLDDLPEFEESLESTESSVEELAGSVQELQRSLAALRERVDEVESRMATGGDVSSLEAEVDRVEGQVETLREQLRSADWVQPAQLDSHARDVDALRETVVDHARRLEGVEQSTSDLDDRLEQAFRDTAKAEALSSLQAEVSRLQREESTADDGGGTVSDELTARLDSLSEEVDQLRMMVDSIAESSVTRSELEETTGALEGRLADLEASTQRRDQVENEAEAGEHGAFVRLLLSVALASVAVLGALLALEFDRPGIAVAFIVLVAGPAVLLFLLDRVNR